MNELEVLVMALSEAREAYDAEVRRAPVNTPFAAWPADVQRAVIASGEVLTTAERSLAKVGAALRAQLFARAA